MPTENPDSVRVAIVAAEIATPARGREPGSPSRGKYSPSAVTGACPVVESGSVGEGFADQPFDRTVRSHHRRARRRWPPSSLRPNLIFSRDRSPHSPMPIAGWKIWHEGEWRPYGSLLAKMTETSARLVAPYPWPFWRPISWRRYSMRAQPINLTPRQLKRITGVPPVWDDQRRRLGFRP